MKFYRRYLSFTVVLLSLIVLVCPAAAQSNIWNSGSKTFTKANNANWQLPANQDCITPSVCLTRASTQALFNAVSETSYSYAGLSPVDTEWAFAGLNGNPSTGVTASNRANLHFTNFTDALDFMVGDRIVGRPGVLHIKSSNIYLNITFSSWTIGYYEGETPGGGFSYVRTTTGTSTPTPTPVPAPPALILTCTGLGAAALYELKRRLAHR